VPTSGLKIVTYVDLGGPAVGDAALHGPEPAETYGVTLQVSGRDEEPAAEPGRERLDRRLCDVRDSQVGRGELVAERVGDPCVDLDRVRPGIPPGLLDRLRFDVHGPDGPVAEPRRRDRQHPGPTSDVEHARPGVLLVQRDEELQAQPRRRMTTGAEGPRRLDHDAQRIRRRDFPRRPDPQRPDSSRTVELTPPLLPARRDVGCRHGREGAPDLGLPGLVRIRGELECARLLPFLESLRKELDEDRAGDLRLGGREGDGDAP